MLLYLRDQMPKAFSFYQLKTSYFTSSRETESELQSTKDQLNLFKSSVSAKDETIMSLTNKILDLECNAGQSSSQQNLAALHLAEMEKLKVSVNLLNINIRN